MVVQRAAKLCSSSRDHGPTWIIHFGFAFGSVKSGGHTRQPFPPFHSVAAPVLFRCLGENSPHLDTPSGLLWCRPLVLRKATKSILRLDWFWGQLPWVSILHKDGERNGNKTATSNTQALSCGDPCLSLLFLSWELGEQPWWGVSEQLVQWDIRKLSSCQRLGYA